MGRYRAGSGDKKIYLLVHFSGEARPSDSETKNNIIADVLALRSKR